MSRLTDAKRILVRARSILSDRKRWYKGDFIRKEPGQRQYAYCALGALGAASGSYAPSMPETAEDALPDLPAGYDLTRVLDVAKSALHRHLPAGNGRSIMQFNDRERTTHEDMLHLFDEAITDLGQQVEREGVKS